MSSLKAWIMENKLKSVGAFWATTFAAAIVYNRKMTSLKPGLQIMKARIYAQALTIGVLGVVALMGRYEDASCVKTKEDGHAVPQVAANVVDVEADTWNW